MGERAPAFQFYPRQFAGDDRVMGMDLEAIGAHILLMCAAAASPERWRIHAEEYAIRMRLRNPSDEAWQRIKKQLLAGPWKLSDDGKWWIQSGLERTFQKQKEFSDRQREKANQKWNKDSAKPMPETCQADAQTMPECMPERCSSSSSSSSNLNTLAQTAFADVAAVSPTETKSSKLTEEAVGKIYRLYPKKRNKIDGIKASWKAIAKVKIGDADHPAIPRDDDALDYLVQRVTLFSQYVRDVDPQFIPYLATWLNKGAFWDDEHDWKRKASRGQNNIPAQLPPDYVSPSDKMRQRGSQTGGVQ